VIRVLVLSIGLVATIQTPPPTMKTVHKGALSQIDTSRQVIVKTPVEFATMWKSHAADRRMPDVDFTTNMVVGIFLGSRPTAGYGAEIVSALPESGVLVVKYRETRPSPDLIAAQMLTAPFHLVSVPKFDGPVRFEKLP
jgi:protease stability complex PrcB-like protein